MRERFEDEPVDLQTILPLAKALPVADQRVLIDELFLAMPDDDEDDFGLSNDQIAMIESRDAELRANPGIALTRDEFNARMRAGR
jgi:putative addiction module component (TIGR02574 family)